MLSASLHRVLSYSMRTLVALAILQRFSLTCLAAVAVSKTSTWQQLGSGFQSVISYQAVETCRSNFDCARRCLGYTHCTRVAFRRSTRSCYLLPVTQAQSGGTEDDVIILDKEDPICSVRDAPVPNAEVTWNPTLTSLEGDVTCHPSHVWTTNDTSVNCSADGVWRVGGECTQKYWIHPVGMRYYPLPRTPGVGWKLCAHGTPFANASELTFHLYDANGDRPYVVSFKFNENRTIFFSWKSGTYFYNTEQVTSPAFPLVQLVPFFLELVASSEYAFDVYVNGALYHHRSTPANVTTSVTTIVTGMLFWGEVEVHDLDLWCE